MAPSRHQEGTRYMESNLISGMPTTTDKPNSTKQKYRLKMENS
jgi:hypothetical protein